MLAPMLSPTNLANAQTHAPRGKVWILGFSLVSLIGLQGCSVFNVFDSGGEVATSSIETGAFIEPKLPTAVFAAADDQATDVYLTDLPIARLADSADDLAGLTGSIVHVHIFLVPEAGKTPLDDTAVNSAVRHLVIANGAAGLYSGGGFSMAAEADGAVFSADVRNASLRLAHATPNFTDRLGPALLRGSFTASLDEKACAVLADRLARASFDLPRVGAVPAVDVPVVPPKPAARDRKNTR